MLFSAVNNWSQYAWVVPKILYNFAARLNAGRTNCGIACTHIWHPAAEKLQPFDNTFEYLTH